MQRSEVSGAVRPIYESLGAKRLTAVLFAHNSSIACTCNRRTCWVPRSCAQGWATEGNWAPEADADSDCHSAVHVPHETRRRDRRSNPAGSCEMPRVVSTGLDRTDGNKLLYLD